MIQSSKSLKEGYFPTVTRARREDGNHQLYDPLPEAILRKKVRTLIDAPENASTQKLPMRSSSATDLRTSELKPPGESSNLRQRVEYHFSESATAKKDSTLKKTLKKNGLSADKPTHELIRFKYVEVPFGNPLSPPSAPVQRRLQRPRAKSKFLAVKR
ncbi:hypothetical protein N9845_02640, partial [Akkermansiaceae bacterium]|nr:hypothetical protein [Akkermansiaceae bacterium]